MITKSTFAAATFCLLGSVAIADDFYADGKLMHPLSIQVTETGGFVGQQSYSIKIVEDGSCSYEHAIGRRPSAGPSTAQEGAVAAESLEALAKVLADSELLGLPKRVKGSTKLPGGAADIPTIEAKITFGRHTVTATYFGFDLDKDPKAEELERVNEIINTTRKVVLAAVKREAKK